VNLLVYLTYFIVLWLQSLVFENCWYSISCNLFTCVCYRCSDYIQLFLLYALSLLILGTHVFGTGLLGLLFWVKLISHSILVSISISFWVGSYLYILTTVHVSLLGRESSVLHHLLTNPQVASPWFKYPSVQLFAV